MVAGDFDQDGFKNDIAVFYDYGGNQTRIHVFTSGGSVFSYSGAQGWWDSSGYTADQITGHVVAGDFDQDGCEDDVAVFCNYGGNQTRIHVFTSDGSAFSYSGSLGWWNSLGYNADQITGRVVVGDFDRDGFKDDIAVFYSYGGSQTRIHVFTSNGNSFSYSRSAGWWNSLGYTADQITGRVVAGDFDRDGYEDDVAVFYNYGGSQTRIHVFTSNGNSFSYSGSAGWWSSFGYIADRITGHVVAGDFDQDGFKDDIAVFYDYGNSQTRTHVFRSNGSSFSYSGSKGWWNSNTETYNADSVRDRVVAVDYTKDGTDDIVSFYEYPMQNIRSHGFESQGTSFIYQGALGIPWLSNISP
ncbi:MAG: hypothetical protein GKR87_12210 [Kiritimatiellae bacterium]|nr:hypothetical protein [Kiritimatiellia bacterium]